MWARSFALSIAFRRGLQWPFREGDTLRVYAEGDRELLAELPAVFVLELVRHYLTAHALQAEWAAYRSPQPAPAARPVPKPPPPPRLPAAAGRRLRGRRP
jgi:hypothetical protein